ncbi:hypothetical protein Cgig2_007348 [Carnegiea gigantea]|uniref:Cyanobacterial aminoacyl-tRNA synthetase CAAD domain-containing protein n=1 Tax=Carnegiea gigantea TaxID=171969 RepID=A0A9Q1KXT2_9CARY|nr:hypothetical protein Cgig2_007348 [Carnegiea gigantea]
MELCITRSLSNPNFRPHRFSINESRCNFNPYLSFKSRAHFLGGRSHTSILLRATSDEPSSGVSKSEGERSSTVATLEEVSSVNNDAAVDNYTSFNRSVYDETRQSETTTSDEPMQLLNELLGRLNIKLDSENSYTIFLYGGGALVALWLLSTIVGAIDSIPVFPKLMEVVGLGYSVWFTTRYLLFKRNREELVSKIEELKREILGSSDD